MPVPKNQITLRTTEEDLVLLERVKSVINERSVIAPRDGEVNRAIYHRGLIAWAAELGISTTSPTPPGVTRAEMERLLASATPTEPEIETPEVLSGEQQP